MRRAPSEIFISYSDSEIDRIRPLIDALQAEGWSVWWDRRILPGQSRARVIESTLDEARCVVVVWSHASVASEWVQLEAEEARTRGILVPVLVDHVKIPLPFRHIQAADLTGWSGGPDDLCFDSLRAAIRAILATTPGTLPREAAAASPVASPVQETRAEVRPPEPAGLPDWLAVPESPDPNKPFLMPVEDVFVITGRGVVVTGRIAGGTCSVGEEMEIVGFLNTRRTTIAGIEMFKKLVDQGRAGDNVGVLLRGVQKGDVKSGQVLARLGSIHAYAKFTADIYLLPEQEGGRPLAGGSRSQFWFRTTDVAGVAKLPRGMAKAKPGTRVPVEVELVDPVAMDKGTLFAIREGGVTVGAGRVSAPLPAPHSGTIST